MKYWWKNIVKDYLTFSAKERNGLIIMFVIGAAFFISSRFYTPHRSSVSKDAFQKELAQLQIFVDSSNTNNNYRRSENYTDYSKPKSYQQVDIAEKEVFDFDPNSLDQNGWKKLGIREKTIQTIQKFLASGFRFRQSEDITKIYGLSKEDAKRLIPHIHIAAEVKPVNASYFSSVNTASVTTAKSALKTTRIIDINTADTTALISLHGIGNKLAGRIVNFRQKLGGFSSVEQIAETYGLPDSTFQKIRPLLQCLNPTLKTININTASLDELRSHPYIRWNIANAIINYRQQHGNYKSIEDLKKIDIITDEMYKKISSYVAI